jgi:hypothetical protein
LPVTMGEDADGTGDAVETEDELAMYRGFSC